MDSDIAIYTDMLLSLQLGNYRGVVSLSKPLYLISIIDSIKNKLEKNVISLENIAVEQRFKELYKKYQCGFAYSKSTFIAPFFHLASSEFYHLIWKKEVVPPSMSATPSAKYLCEHLQYAKLDDELWELLQDAENRDYFRRKIINRYL